MKTANICVRSVNALLYQTCSSSSLFLGTAVEDDMRNMFSIWRWSSIDVLYVQWIWNQTFSTIATTILQHSNIIQLFSAVVTWQIDRSSHTCSHSVNITIIIIKMIIIRMGSVYKDGFFPLIPSSISSFPVSYDFSINLIRLDPST